MNYAIGAALKLKLFINVGGGMAVEESIVVVTIINKQTMPCKGN